MPEENMRKTPHAMSRASLSSAFLPSDVGPHLFERPLLPHKKSDTRALLRATANPAFPPNNKGSQENERTPIWRSST